MTVVDFVWAERRLVELLGAEECLWMLDVDAWVDYLGTHALRIVVASSIGVMGDKRLSNNSKLGERSYL